MNNICEEKYIVTPTLFNIERMIQKRYFQLFLTISQVFQKTSK